MGKNKLTEDVRQLSILAQKVVNEKKFGDKTYEFQKDFQLFISNIQFCFRDMGTDAVSGTKINKDGLDRLSDAIDNLKSMKGIAEEYGHNNLVGYINSIIDYLREVEQNLKPKVK